jgi:hypothetical protein
LHLTNTAHKQHSDGVHHLVHTSTSLKQSRSTTPNTQRKKKKDGASDKDKDKKDKATAPPPKKGPPPPKGGVNVMAMMAASGAKTSASKNIEFDKADPFKGMKVSSLFVH